MTAPAGLSAFLMLAEESTYGTYAAVTRTYDLLPGESIKNKVQRIESKALRAGRRYLTSQQWVAGEISVAGDIPLEYNAVGFGVFWKHILGAVSSSNAGTAYTHTFTPGDLTGKSLSVQVARIDTSATYRPFSYTGAKITAAELSCKVGEVAQLKLTVDAQNESTAQTLGKPYFANGSRTTADGVTTNLSPTVTSATAAFTQADVNAPITVGSNLPAGTTILTVTNATTVTVSQNATATGSAQALAVGAPAMALTSFVQGALTIGGTSTPVKDVSLKFASAMATNRYLIGPNGALAKEQLENGLKDISGTITPEFTDLTAYNRYINGTEAALVLTFTSGTTIPGSATPYSTTITLNVRFDGDTPNVASADIIAQPLQFKVVAPTQLDSSAVTVAYVTSDTTP